MCQGVTTTDDDDDDDDDDAGARFAEDLRIILRLTEVNLKTMI